MIASSAQAFANDGAKAPVVEKTATVTVSPAVKAPVLLDRRAPSRRVVKIVHKPATAPVARKASMESNSRFVFSSPTSTNTKTYRPAEPKHAGMPNLFKK